MSQDRTCIFCWDEIQHRGGVNGCRHTFCFDCISRWSQQQNFCPLCRAPFTELQRYIREDELVCILSVPLGRRRQLREIYNYYRIPFLVFLNYVFVAALFIWVFSELIDMIYGKDYTEKRVEAIVQFFRDSFHSFHV